MIVSRVMLFLANIINILFFIIIHKEIQKYTRTNLAGAKEPRDKKKRFQPRRNTAEGERTIQKSSWESSQNQR